jgi:ABC-type phosphate transport system auxiliary subunit
MSLKKDKNVPQLVEKYKQKFQAFTRSQLRTIIRVENPLLFNKDKNFSYQSNLKSLDRYLRKAFQNKTKDVETKKPIEKIGFFERRELNKNLEAERVAEEKRQLERSSNAALKALADHLDLKLTKTYFKNLEETEKS